jgi:F-type H+-transporting ATPase subunit a
MGLIWWVVRGATSGVPTKRQAFVELLIDFVDEQAKGIFQQGDRHRFIAPLALTVFVVGAADERHGFPARRPRRQAHASRFRARLSLRADSGREAPPFALSISVSRADDRVRDCGQGRRRLAARAFLRALRLPSALIPANFLFQMVEYISKTLSHSLRLFGNMYAGEILFLLLWLWAANSFQGDFGVGWLASVVLGLGWAIFHILIVVLQAYIFMMLTIVYVSMAHEHH